MAEEKTTTPETKPKYSTTEFNVAARDDKGHYSNMSFIVPPPLAQQTTVLVQCQRFPYSSVSALLRHALMRHVRWLQSFKEPVKSVMGQVEIINKLMIEDEHLSAFRTTFDRLMQRVNDYIGLGDKNEAVRLILEVKKHIKDMPGSYWKKKYMEELERRCGGYVSEIGNANLLDFNEDEEDEEDEYAGEYE
jgi:hypothetical protein